MFLTKKDIALLRDFAMLQMSQAKCIIDISEKLKNMPTRAELKAALDSENDAINAAAERWQKKFSDKVGELQDQVNNLQSKHEGDEDFSAELAKVNDHINALNALAQQPLSASTQPPATSATTATGASGATVGGPELHDASIAAGAEEPAADSHAGSATTPHDPNAGDAEPTAEPTTGTSTPADQNPTGTPTPDGQPS